MKSSRLPWLLLALAGTAALAAYGEARDEGLAAPVAPTSFPELAPVIRALDAREFHAGAGRDPFSIIPPPAAAETAAPDAVSPAPSISPPVFAWRVIGKQHDEHEGWSVFLVRGEETAVVHAGDMLDDSYRVATIMPPTLTLQHIHSKTRRKLDIGEARE